MMDSLSKVYIKIDGVLYLKRPYQLSLCRLCGSERAKYNVVSETLTKKGLADIIQEVTNIKITKFDPVTKKICAKCRNRVHKIADYLRSVKDVQASLWSRVEAFPESRSSNTNPAGVSSVNDANHTTVNILEPAVALSR